MLLILVVLFAHATFDSTHLAAQTQEPGQEQAPASDGQAAPPIPTEEVAEIPLPNFDAPPEQPGAADKIEAALQGDSSAPLPQGVLGDVIGIIRQNGSVLDGSSLDPRRETELGGHQVQAEQASPAAAAAPFETAEALLRSARLLESYHDRRPEVSDAAGKRMPVLTLVRQMRMQAARLLAAEFSPAIP
ncbi:hypothetical protein [Allorhodopirellula solitaria]|uniref:hypothetical protein n=1 Tax=Allorhodopirellula solitaria TaxID=2527987 RepID=UPI001648E8AF|nr:hypothetical protein [Allorhodopirellula solitaria]